MHLARPRRVAENLVDVIAEHLSSNADADSLTFVGRHGEIIESLDRRGLDLKVRRIAAYLQQTVTPGARVIIVQPPGLDYVAAFLACQYAGVIAVTTYPRLLTRGQDRFAALVADADPELIMTSGTSTAAGERLVAAGFEPAGVRWCDVDDAVADPATWRRPDINADDVAFLQYTSGTTAMPKGVMVTHNNVMVNSSVLRAQFGYGPESRMVSWLPPYHDMGLIGGVIQPLFTGFPAVLMAPATFATDPYRWLAAFSDYRGTCSFAPTFALDLCVDTVTADQRQSLDLRSWRTLTTGAEPLRFEALERFAATFAECGFADDVVGGGYGLAESTLVVTGDTVPVHRTSLTVSGRALDDRRVEVVTADADDARVLVGSGTIADSDAALRVVDPETRRPCALGQVGELWLAGSSVARGYWRRPDATSETFHATTDAGEGPYLRTGDLGFLHDGHLYVCGRIKDLIIVRGRNIYPQDVEACAGHSHPAVRTNLCAAAAIEVDGIENLLIVAEIERSHPTEQAADVADAIRTAVTAEFDVPIHAVVLIRSATIPRTSSGKIQRHACVVEFTEGSLTEIHRWTAAPDPGAADVAEPTGGGTHPAGEPAVDTVVRATGSVSVPDAGAGSMGELLRTLDSTTRVEVATADIRRRVAATIGAGTGSVEAVGAEHSMLLAGLDSIGSFRLQHHIERDYAVTLTVADLLTLTPRELATQVVAAFDVAMSDTPGMTVQPRPQDRYEPFPLTDVQHAYLTGRSPAFRLGGVGTYWYGEFERTGLDVDRLSRGLNQLVRRHDMLRAVITPDLRQRVLEDVPDLAVITHDLRDLDDEARVGALATIRDRLSHEVVILDTWPLFRLEISLLPGDRVRVHVGLDLMVLDVRSAQVLFEEWRACYDDPAVSLPQLELTFRDCVTALEESRADVTYDRAKAYWVDRLATLPLAPELPLRHDVAESHGQRFTRFAHRIPAEVWQRLQAAASAQGMTSSALLLAAYAATIGTWSRTKRFLLTLTLFNRPLGHQDVERVIGDFTSLSLLEVNVEMTTTFGEFARGLQEQLRRDLDHRQFSGVEVLREVTRRTGERADTHPAVVFTSGRNQSVGGTDMPTEWLGDEVFAVSQTPQVAIDHQVLEVNGELALSWDAIEALFPDGVVEQMFGAYTELLYRLASPDGARWSGAPHVVPAEHADAIAEINDTHAPVPSGPLHGPLLDHASATPEAVAVIGPERTMTYGELVQEATALAHRLRESGVQPRDLVAVVSEKSTAQVVAVLAVLLASGAYLPVDPELPHDRQDHLVTQGGARAVLVTPPCARTWPEGVAQIVMGDEPASGEQTPLDWHGDPADPAYVIYTSGSTGLPKGVVSSHRAAVNTCDDIVRRFGVGSHDRVLGLSSMSFDLSVFDVFGVLGAGGALVVPDPSDRRNPARWSDLIVTHGVTIWNSVPTLMQMYVEYLDGGSSPDQLPIRLAMMSGDWIPVDLADRIRSHAPAARVMSLGGATEAAIWSIAHEIDGPVEAGREWDSVPYGRPLRSQEIHVLDTTLRPCPQWVAGDLYIGGVGLADGYRHDVERTATSFVTNPHTGQRLYRTGDVGRWRPGWLVEFLGRDDTQVKVGGYRIELGEIEAVVERHPVVRTAVASAVGDRHHRRLVVHVIPAADHVHEEASTLAAAVREHGQHHLPYYMVPATVVVVDTVPLTSNGKVDRRALETAAESATLGHHHATATNDGFGASGEGHRLRGRTAELLLGLAARELGTATVDPDINLFDLGIDSVHMVRIHRELWEATGHEIDLTLFFEHPTIRSLATYLDGGREDAHTGIDDTERARVTARRRRRAAVAHTTATEHLTTTWSGHD